jgi:hypothetical protein
MPEPEQRKWYEHPLANVLVGFLLTGVLGTALTQHFMDRREREKLRAQAALDRKEVVVALSELLAYDFSWGSIMGGYRYMNLDYETDTYKINLALSGPVLGAAFSF